MSDPITRLNAALEGRYRVESELGEGGMATVYLADDIKHERRVALKGDVPPRMVPDPMLVLEPLVGQGVEAFEGTKVMV